MLRDRTTSFLIAGVQTCNNTIRSKWNSAALPIINSGCYSSKLEELDPLENETMSRNFIQETLTHYSGPFLNRSDLELMKFMFNARDGYLIALSDRLETCQGYFG